MPLIHISDTVTHEARWILGPFRMCACAGSTLMSAWRLEVAENLKSLSHRLNQEGVLYP